MVDAFGISSWQRGKLLQLKIVLKTSYPKTSHVDGSLFCCMDCFLSIMTENLDHHPGNVPAAKRYSPEIGPVLGNSEPNASTPDSASAFEYSMIQNHLRPRITPDKIPTPAAAAIMRHGFFSRSHLSAPTALTPNGPYSQRVELDLRSRSCGLGQKTEDHGTGLPGRQ
jgi:hypothetical protein